jgi:Translation initiation factor IF-2, N-terminal region.
MTSKELLEHLARLKIPAKNHASTLVEAYVDKIRKDLAPVIEQKQAELEAKRKKQEEAERKKREAAEKKRQAEEEARRQAEEEARRIQEAEEAAAREAAERKKEEEERKKREAEEAARKDAERKAEEERARLAEQVAKIEADEAERYRQMARDAEASQVRSQQLIAEAAKMAAGATAPGKRKKSKKPSGKRERTEPHVESPAKTVEPVGSEIVIAQGATVGEFADAVGLPSTDIIKRLMLLGEPLTVNQPLSADLMEILGDDLGLQLEIRSQEEEMGFVFHD